MHTGRDLETDRETGRHGDIHGTEMQIETCRQIWAGRQTSACSQACRQAGMQTDIHTDRHADADI